MQSISLLSARPLFFMININGIKESITSKTWLKTVKPNNSEGITIPTHGD